MSSITFKVDETIAATVAKATDTEKIRMEEAFGLWLQIYFAKSKRKKLSLITRYFRQKANERGLTVAEIDAVLANG